MKYQGQNQFSNQIISSKSNHNSHRMSTIKTPVELVLVGDPEVGKSCLLSSLITGQIPLEYVPTVWDKHVAEYQSRALVFVDTGGCQSVDRLRSTAYYHSSPDTIYLVCFSINNHHSFANVSEKWIPDIRHHDPYAKCILVGTQSDLRRSAAESIKSVSNQESLELALNLGCVQYAECSSLTQEGVEEMLEMAVEAATEIIIQPQKKNKKWSFKKFLRKMHLL